MARRRRAREIAFQLLYQTDLNPDVPTDAIRDTIRQQLHSQALQEFAWQLFAGVTESRGTLDDRIQCVAKNWTLKRMAAIDRNILRLGAYELFFTQTPYQVVIDEAIELAKRYGAAQSSQFVNGVLDRLVPPERRQTGPEPAPPKD